MKNRFITVFVKILLAIALLVLFGLPILETWKMLIVLSGWLALICCDIRPEKWRIFAAAGIVLFVPCVISLLPRAQIEEGHNIFFYHKPGEAIQQALPPDIFAEWKQSFDGVYPPQEEPHETYTWRWFAAQPSSGVPKEAFAYSSDSLWRPALYSRQVDTINFRSLREFRGGFANDQKYNWWKGDLDRHEMPFFVTYQFSRQSVGSKMQWRGTLYWEKSPGSYEKIIHESEAAKVITPGDAGRKIYMLFLPKSASGFFVHLSLSPKLKTSLIIKNILSVIGALSLFGLMAKIKWSPFLTAIFLTLVSISIIYMVNSFNGGGQPVGASYTPHGGGDDGLFHESRGRDIARFFSEGQIAEALKGYEEVYFSTPGMRYFRGVEKILFGDTNLGYTAFIACLPWIIYLLMNQLCGPRCALWSTVIFLFSPMAFSFIQYIFIVFVGYAESMGSGLFLIGLLLFLRSQPLWGGNRDAWFAFLGGIILAGSMFVRPNLALAVALLGLFFLHACWRDRDFTLMACASAGLASALLMPVHNLYFGHEFYLISKAGATISLTLSPVTYLRALGELATRLTGHGQTPHLSEAVHQIKGWLWTPPSPQFPPHKGIPLLLSLKLFTLFVTFYALFISPKRFPRVSLLAWVALAAHLPMLFVFETSFRYGMLAWDLSAIITLVIVAKYKLLKKQIPINK